MLYCLMYDSTEQIRLATHAGRQNDRLNRSLYHNYALAGLYGRYEETPCIELVEPMVNAITSRMIWQNHAVDLPMIHCYLSLVQSPKQAFRHHRAKPRRFDIVNSTMLRADSRTLIGLKVPSLKLRAESMMVDSLSSSVVEP